MIIEQDNLPPDKGGEGRVRAAFGVLPQQRDVVHLRHLPINVRRGGKGTDYFCSGAP
jgi:hypothetical protein